MIWPLVELGSLCDVVRGSSPRPKGDPQFYGGSIPRLMVGDVTRDGKIVTPKIDSLTEAGAQKSRPMKAGDFVIAVSGQPGQPLILAIDACIHDGFAGLRNLDETRVSKNYLFHFMIHTKAKFESIAVGAIFKNLTTDQIRGLKIPLPPLTEQKRIAGILDKADAIRRKRQQAIQLADDFLSAEFLQRFGDPKDSPFGSKSLKDVTLKITDGAHFTPTYVESGIPFLRVTDIHRDLVDWSQVKYIPLEEHQELIKRCKPEKGDVLYSKNGTIGVPKIIDWDREFSIFVSLCLIKPDPKYLRGWYLYSFLKTPFALKQATQKSKSATVTNLHLVEIKEILLPVPSLAVQDAWIDFLSNFSRMRGRLVESIRKSNDVFNSFSQKAFSGQL